MTITQDTFVAIKYTLKNKDGQIIDSSTDEPLEFIAGRGFLIAGLEKELEGKKAGDKFSAVIPPAEAYGEYSEQLKVSVPRSQFDTDFEIEVGMQFQAGMGQIVTVKEVKENEIVIDANHPLAGETMHFTGSVIDVRDATAEEIATLFAQDGGGGCSGCSDDGCGSRGHGC